MIVRSAVIVAVLVTLAACGKQGELQRPQPLRGSAAAADYERNRSATPGENVDPASTNRSPRAAPIQGVNDPVGAPPSIQ